MLNTTHRRSLFVLASATVMGVASFYLEGAYAQHPIAGTASAEGVLVMRSGEVFRGTITRAGDRHLVTVPGGQISVKSSDVDVCCRSLEEAYQLRKRRKPSDSVRDHLELAQWCQRHGMLDAARQELADAKAVDPSHPMIPLLERRVAAVRIAEQPKPASGKPLEGRLAAADLDRMIRGMPSGTVETFTQIIQPMLMNNCTTAGCHGPGATDTFSLIRIPPNSPPSRRMTQRNLHAVLQWVNLESPEASPLLVAPSKPHGPARAPVFTDRQVAQYRQLLEWVYRVSQMPAPPPPVVQANHEAPKQGTSQVDPAVFNAPEETDSPESPFPPNLMPEGHSPEDPNGPSGNLPSGPPASVPPTPPWGPQSTRPDVQRGADIPQFVPADPFDPEIFNRQYFPAEK